MAQRAQLHGKDLIYSMFNQACKACKANKLDEALTIADDIIKIDSTFLQAFTLRGWLYHLKKDNESALKDLNDSLNQFPENADALISRGRVYLDQEEYTLAMTDFIAAIRAARNDFSPINNLGTVACDRVFELFKKLENKAYEPIFNTLFPKAKDWENWSVFQILSKSQYTENTYFLVFLWLYDNELLTSKNFANVMSAWRRDPDLLPLLENMKLFYRALEERFNTPCAKQIKDIEAYLKKLSVAQDKQRAPDPLPSDFSLAFLIKHLEFKDYANYLPSLIQLGTTKDVFYRQVPVLTVLLVLAAHDNNHEAIELLIKTGASTIMPRRFDASDSNSPFFYTPTQQSRALLFCLANDIDPNDINYFKKIKDKIIELLATLPARILDPALERYQDATNPSPLRKLIYANRGRSVFGLFIIPGTDTECTDNSDAATKMAALIASRKAARETEKRTQPNEGIPLRHLDI